MAKKLSQEEKDQKKKIILAFGLSENDTGSPEVQVALLTWRIKRLQEHLQKHPHDFHSKRGLVKLVHRRRRMLKYLQSLDNQRYEELARKLGLK